MKKILSFLLASAIILSVFTGCVTFVRKQSVNAIKKSYSDSSYYEREQKEMKEAQQVLMKSMLALMSHAIDGNHTEDLRLARDDMQNYLLRR